MTQILSCSCKPRPLLEFLHVLGIENTVPRLLMRRRLRLILHILVNPLRPVHPVLIVDLSSGLCFSLELNGVNVCECDLPSRTGLPAPEIVAQCVMCVH